MQGFQLFQKFFGRQEQRERAVNDAARRYNVQVQDDDDRWRRIEDLNAELQTRIRYLAATPANREHLIVPEFNALSATGKDASDALTSDFGTYNYRQVEALLNQAADLLDRCLKDRSEWNSLRARFVYLVVELNRELMDLFEMRAVITADIHKTPKFIHEQMKGALYQNLNGPYPTYNQVQDSYADAKNHFSSGSGASYSAKASSQNVGLQIREANAKLEAETRQEKDCETSIAVTEVRLAVASYNMETKLRAVLDGGPLDYRSQIIGLRQRIDRDFGDAVRRLTAAAEGLDKIYRYSTHEAWGFDVDSSLEDIVRWQRNAIAWLVALNQHELSATRVFSVRSLATAQWDSAVVGAPPYTFNIATPFDNMWGMRNLRLRGASVVLIGGDSRNVWAGSLKPPSLGIYQSPKTGEPNQEFDQTDLSRCTFGRIQANDSTREIEVLGQISWVNISPISADATSWELVLTPVSALSRIQDLEDVHIEMHYSGMPIDYR